MVYAKVFCIIYSHVTQGERITTLKNFQGTRKQKAQWLKAKETF